MKHIFLLAVLGLFVPLAAIGQPGPGPRADRGPVRGSGMRILDELKLTEEQQKKVQELRFDLMKQVATQRAKIATAMVEFRELAAKDNPDRSALEKKIREISDLRAQMQTLRLNQWFNVNKLLTPEQQKVWKKALDGRVWMERRGFMRQRMRGMMRDRMGPPMREPF